MIHIDDVIALFQCMITQLGHSKLFLCFASTQNGKGMHARAEKTHTLKKAQAVISSHLNTISTLCN